MMLHAEKIDDKGETKAHRKMGRKMVLKQMGRFLGNSLTDITHAFHITQLRSQLAEKRRNELPMIPNAIDEKSRSKTLHLVLKCNGK